MLLKESAGRLNSFWGVVGGSCGWSGVSDSLVANIKYEVVNLFVSSLIAGSILARTS